MWNGPLIPFSEAVVNICQCTYRSEVEVELGDLQVLFQFVSLRLPGVLPGATTLFRHHQHLLNLILSDRLRILQEFKTYRAM